MTPSLWLVVTGLYGSLVGSFLNVCIHRIPLRESIVFPASHCPRCQAAIRWFDNIPLFSYLWLRGRCRSCRASISPVYPLVELVAALLAVAVAARFGWSWESLALACLLFAFLVLSVIDLFHYILPDVITLPGIILGLALSSVLGSPFPTLADALWGAGVGGGGLWAFATLFEKLTGKQGMGFGDVKLLAMIGAWMGWQALPASLFFASVLGTVVGLGWILLFGRDRRLPIPFGPYLALAAIMHLFYGRQLWQWYLAFALPGHA